jgi:hypothetical protein
VVTSRLLSCAGTHGSTPRFTYAAWNHPRTVAIVSKLAGVDLVPWAAYEIAHVNLCVYDQRVTDAPASATQLSLRGEECPVVGWHTDSYPFVCVLMLSDCTDMRGGETAVRTANGEVIRIPGPAKGSAVVLQGRHVTHQVLRPAGAQERITAVTSWRPGRLL